jgi:multisubunit Na+/H+ antiporter MnhB subunit
MDSALAKALGLGILGLLILAISIFLILFAATVRAVSLRVVSNDTRKKYRLARAPSVRLIRFIGVLWALLAVTVLLGAMH